MSIKESSLFNGDKKKKQTWSKSIEKNGLRKSINVREADNGGYIIRLEAYGDVPKKDGDGTEYKSVEKEIISKINPLADASDPMDEFLSEDMELNEI